MDALYTKLLIFVSQQGYALIKQVWHKLQNGEIQVHIVNGVVTAIDLPTQRSVSFPLRKPQTAPALNK